MGGLIAIVAILTVFGAPTYLITRWMNLRQRRLEIERGTNELLEGMREERKLLEARIESLEDVVHGADFELNQKLRQLELDESKGVTKTRALPSTTTHTTEDETS